MGIILVMIVRNEAAVIRRCLEAALPSIDAWSIVDTGSTDATKAIIQEVLKDVPGCLHDRPWVNFGHNRTESFELARSTALELGLRPCETWCLLLDGDHELQGTLNREALSEPAYFIRQHDSGLLYSNTRLIRADLPWRSIGVTHEFWGADGASINETLEGVQILDHADGGTRSEKYERDLRLLEQGLKDEPANVRYMFYLAQTYEGIGRLNDAINMYRKRADAGGFPEEAWMARLRLGKLLSQMCRIIEAQTEWLRCFNERPQRAEPLYYLALQLLDVGCHSAAYLYAKQAASMPIPDGEIMFVEHPVYRWKANEAVGRAAYYLGKRAEGLEAVEAVLAKPNANHHGALHDLTFYTDKLPGTRGTFEIPEASRTFDGTVFHASSPSVVDDVTIVRCVNYDQERGKHYAGRPEPGIIRTKNKVLKGGGSWTLNDSILDTWNQATRIFGLEDIRLIKHQGELFFSATCCQVPGKGGNAQVVLGKIAWVPDGTVLDIDPPFYPERPVVTHLVPLAYEHSKTVEKNWLLWSDGRHGLKAIYSFDPFIVLDVNPESGQATEAVKQPTRWYDGRFRGSAPPLRLDWDRWIAVVHDVANGQDRNVYTHRFVTFTREGDVRYTKPFFLDHANGGIEYVTGLSYERGEYTLTYSHEDREARWAKVDSMLVREMLGDAWPVRTRRAA